MVLLFSRRPTDEYFGYYEISADFGLLLES